MSKISENSTALLVVDLQERLVPVIADKDHLLFCSLRAIKAAKILELPILCTEQYPKGLGRTINELAVELKEAHFYEKTSFSCCGNLEFMEKLNLLSVKHLIVIGIETHVCIMQTAFDLLAKGFSVTVLADVTSSRNEDDSYWALRNMQAKGINVSTFETEIFGLLKDSKHPKFKEISALLRANSNS